MHQIYKENPYREIQREFQTQNLYPKLPIKYTPISIETIWNRLQNYSKNKTNQKEIVK